MSNSAMGEKRQCLSCNAKFFDLAKDPIKCPKCGAIFEPVVLARSPPRRMGRTFPSTPQPFENQGAAVEEADVAVISSDEEDGEDDDEKQPLTESDA